MNRVMNLFRISIHPDEKVEFLRLLGNLASYFQEVEQNLISFYAFRSPEQEDLYLILEIFTSEQAYLDYLNSESYQRYQELTQPFVREQAYVRLEGLILLEKLSKDLPQVGSGLRLTLFQGEAPNLEAKDRLNRLTQKYVFQKEGLHAFYLGCDKQSPEDWYQFEIFSQQKEEDLLAYEEGFKHEEVTLRWEPQDLVDFSLGMDVVATRGIELWDLGVL